MNAKRKDNYNSDVVAMKLTPSHVTTLEALADMWGQYCPPPYTHMFMSAGEGTEYVLDQYKLLYKRGDKRGQVNWQQLEKLRRKADKNYKEYLEQPK